MLGLIFQVDYKDDYLIDKSALWYMVHKFFHLKVMLDERHDVSNDSQLDCFLQQFVQVALVKVRNEKVISPYT